MSDHLLRLARVVAEVTTRTHPTSSVESHAWNLVRDLEAAPATERRTITREEFAVACGILNAGGADTRTKVVQRIAAAWRLTVEDA